MKARRWPIPLVIVLVLWGLITHGKYSVSGDEPHYLMVSRSLWLDGDLDLANNYAAGDAFGEGVLEAGPHAARTLTGQLHSVHDIGLPVLITPLYAATTSLARVASPDVLRRVRMTRGLFAYSLMSLVLIGLSAAAAAIVRSTLLDQEVSPLVSTVVVLVTWLSVPVLSNSFVVFPEVVMLLISALTLRLWTRAASHVTFGHFATLALLLGISPWLHRKFLLFVLCLAVLVTLKHWQTLRAWSVGRQASLSAALLLPSVALALWTWSQWGNLGGPLTTGGIPLEWNAFKHGSLGLLVDRENGLLVWAPIYGLLPAAFVMAPAATRWWLLPCLCLYILSAAHGQWWAGFSPAGRFLVPLVPLFAFVMATVRVTRATVVLAAVLLVPQLLLTGYSWEHPRVLWPQGNGVNVALEAVFGWTGIHRLLPSLRSTTPDFGMAFFMVAGLVGLTLAVVAIERKARPGQA